MKKKLYRMDYSSEPRRIILCIDVKSFFASVEAVERGIHPLESMIAVVSKPNNQGGLVLASSPLVKKIYGIKTGSRVFDLPRKSDIHIVEPRMALYLDKNLEILRIFKRFVPSDDLLVYSIDEAFLDVTKSRRLFGSGKEIALKIQQQVWNEMGLVLTVGIGSNPLLAKLSLDHQAKKDQANHFIGEWNYEDVEEKVWKIHPMSDFWGIGSRTENTFHRMGIRSIYDLSQTDPKRIKGIMGVIGEQHFYHSHGIDRSDLSNTYIPQSISYSKNQILNRDYKEKDEIEIVIREMTEENAMRLRKHHKVTGTVKLSIGYSYAIEDSGFSRQMKIEPTDQTTKLITYMLHLFRKHWEGYPVRIVNVTFAKVDFKPLMQLNLFEDYNKIVTRENLDKAIDDIRNKYGYTSILHASSLLKGGMALQRAKLLGGHRSGENNYKEE